MSRFFFLLLLTSMIFACAPAAEKDTTLVDSSQAQSMLQANKAMVLLDVRTPEEFASGHISGAQNLDYYQNFETQIASLDKNQEYLVYCAVGGRSGQASAQMKELGFNVKDLQGGIKAWKSAGLPLEK